MSILSEPVLEVRDLVVAASVMGAEEYIIEGISFDLRPHEVLGVVGESGSGKSITMLAITGLLNPSTMRVVSGVIRFQGADLAKLSESQLRKIRGRSIAIVFQDPMTSFNPVLRIGSQIAEMIELHQPRMSRKQVRDRVIELLSLVGVPNPEVRYSQYPHEYSGGMRQRAMIAMAIANDPAVLIADEPTSALDATIQAQVMEVLAEARRRSGAAMVLISHDIGLVAGVADSIAVMYAGKIVERAGTFSLFDDMLHPYTVGLMRSLPRLRGKIETLYSIPGQPPAVGARPSACVFSTRCDLRRDRQECVVKTPSLRPVKPMHEAACHFWQETRAWAARLNSTQANEVGASP